MRKVYLKRFAQSAGPGFLQSHRQVLFLIRPYGVHVSPKMLPLQIKKSVLFLVRPFSRILDHVERFFLNLGPHLEYFLFPWHLFGSTLAPFLVLKTRLWRQTCAKSAPRRPAPKLTHVLGAMLGSFFEYIFLFFLKKTGL